MNHFFHLCLLQWFYRFFYIKKSVFQINFFVSCDLLQQFFEEIFFFFSFPFTYASDSLMLLKCYFLAPAVIRHCFFLFSQVTDGRRMNSERFWRERECNGSAEFPHWSKIDAEAAKELFG